VSKDYLLVSGLKPRGPDEWTTLAKKYNAYAKQHGWPSRNARSLKLKFFSFLKEKKPSGNPHRPDYIEGAIQVWRDFENQSHVLQLDDSENRVTGENGSQADFNDGDLADESSKSDDADSFINNPAGDDSSHRSSQPNVLLLPPRRFRFFLFKCAAAIVIVSF